MRDKERFYNKIKEKNFYEDLLNDDRVDEEASNILFVLNTDNPTPTIDINTAALNDKRSLFIEEFRKSYF